MGRTPATAVLLMTGQGTKACRTVQVQAAARMNPPMDSGASEEVGRKSLYDLVPDSLSLFNRPVKVRQTTFWVPGVHEVPPRATSWRTPAVHGADDGPRLNA
jgi:hypothetical protein